MHSRRLSLLLVGVATSLSLSAVRPVKTKTPPAVSVEHLLQEAETAYRTYRFDAATTALEKYQQALKKRKEELPPRAKLLAEQLARAERMYARAELLHVTDSLLIAKQELFARLPQGGGQILAEETYLAGDSLLHASSYQDALKKNYLRATAQGLRWLSSVEKAGAEHWETRPIDLGALGRDTTLTSPFLLEDGLTLLFARATNQGLGGYDLYMTRLTEQGSSFFEPTLLGMPYNSPSNDYLLAYHESEGWGLLVSDRFAPADSVHVYRFSGRPAFLAGQTAEQEQELSPEETFRRATLQGVLYPDSIQTTSPVTPTARPKEVAELYFLVQGDRVYHRWADFTTAEGMKAFRRAEELRLQLSQLSDQLQSLRTAWQASPREKREALRAEVLLLETRQRELRGEMETALHAARSYEGAR